MLQGNPGAPGIDGMPGTHGIPGQKGDKGEMVCFELLMASSPVITLSPRLRSLLDDSHVSLPC